MLILGLDGALGGFSVALADGDDATEAGSDGPDALEAGLARIAAVLAQRGRTLGELDRLGVGIGPGSFTGVRIALSYAKAIALARRIPLVGVSSYDILTPDDAPATVLTVVQGRPGVISARLRTPEGVTSAIAERGIDVRALHGRADSPARAVARIALTAQPSLSPHAVGPDYGELPAATVKAR